MESNKQLRKAYIDIIRGFLQDKEQRQLMRVAKPYLIRTKFETCYKQILRNERNEETPIPKVVLENSNFVIWSKYAAESVTYNKITVIWPNDGEGSAIFMGDFPLCKEVHLNHNKFSFYGDLSQVTFYSNGWCEKDSDSLKGKTVGGLVIYKSIYNEIPASIKVGKFKLIQSFGSFVPPRCECSDWEFKNCYFNHKDNTCIFFRLTHFGFGKKKVLFDCCMFTKEGTSFCFGSELALMKDCMFWDCEFDDYCKKVMKDNNIPVFFKNETFKKKFYDN